ncbi:MAG: M48 family metallopeptidase [Chitinophagales bacterium]|jgi:predicted Zn-dependent protease
MNIKTSRLVILFLLFATSCKGNTGLVTEKKIVYQFPNTSVVEKIPQDCMAKEDDKLINAASGVESFFLNVVGDEVTEKDENSYGKMFNDAFRKDLKFVTDVNMNRLQVILKKLTPYVQRKGISYSIILVKNDNDVNAWTHAGGYIYVTTGLMKFVNSDDELAFCIAHEIGHNENEHCKASVQRIKTAKNMGATNEMTGMASTIFSAVFAAFNQPQETASDLAGVYLMYKAGYEPQKALDFFDKMSKNEQPNALEKMLRSHPFATERRACLQTYINNAVQ